MNGSLKVVQAIVLLSFVGIFFTSCGGSQTTLASATTSGTTTGGNTGQSSGSTTIEDQEKNATIPSGYSATNLFVTVPDSIDFLNFSSLAGDWSSRCTFTSSSIVNDLTCNFEVNELAIYNEGIKFQYNVPANSCKYIATYPYWYWNHEVGTGPTDISVTVVKNASGTVTSQTCVVDGSAPYACNSLTPPDRANDIEVDVAEDISIKCAYDNSDIDGGQNCCFGKYHLRTNIITPDGATPTDERGKAWGGSVDSCIGGAGKTSWEVKTTLGFPAYFMEKMTPNVARTKIVKIDPTIEAVGGDSNIALANFFTAGIHTHTGYGSASGSATSIYPYFVEPLSDRSGDAVRSGNPHYIFDCLDEAFEVNNRIRVMVQEWDTVAALSTYITTGVSTTGADESGTAPASCPGLTGEPCNQLSDADDFVNNTPSGSYNNSSPANRANYFLYEAYK